MSEIEKDIKDVEFYLSSWKPSPGFMAKFERIKKAIKDSNDSPIVPPCYKCQYNGNRGICLDCVTFTCFEEKEI